MGKGKLALLERTVCSVPHEEEAGSSACVLVDVPDGVWLMYASLQLKGSGLVLDFVREGVEDRFEVNTSLYDIDVSRPVFVEA